MRWMRGSSAVVLVVAAAWSQAQELPDQTIRVVVPITAGSSLDARARVIADALGRRLQRRVIVENRPGAGGTIGTLAVARAKPDGTTLVFNNMSHVVSPHMYPDVGYDPVKDFAPISRAYVAGLVLVAHPSLGVSSVQDLVALARRRSAPLDYASSGIGGAPHLAMEMFKGTADIELVHVPYKGDGQALTDLLAGRVPLMVSGYVVALPQVQAGKLRALGVTSGKRAEIFPNVPTIAESGYPSYVLDAWTGFFAPAGTPVAVIDKLNREIAAALATPAVRESLASTGAVSAPNSPREFAAFVQQEWERYGKLVRKLGLRVE